MKNIGYWLLKLWIKAGLHLYYGKIRISGLIHVPKDKPVLFLPNHQGALMDVLLIVTDCRRKPFFLTRSDVFQRAILKKFFTFLRMLPIYRIRDGRESLKKNKAIFDTCTQLFKKNHALVMFPESNHNLKRKIRPLSKGFTRIVFNTLEQIPKSEIHIIPIGMNYRNITGFPDKVALYYGAPILAKEFFNTDGGQKEVNLLKDAVSDSLKTLTTHIENDDTYDITIQNLEAQRYDYLNPKATNAAVHNAKPLVLEPKKLSQVQFLQTVSKVIFTTLNYPMIRIWRLWVKPKIWEPEFTSTLRFGFALLAYPIYYLLLLVTITAIANLLVGLIVISVLFVFNWGYVRWN